MSVPDIDLLRQRRERASMTTRRIIAVIAALVIVVVAVILIAKARSRAVAQATTRQAASAPTYKWVKTTGNAFLPYEVRSAEQLLALYDMNEEVRARFKAYFKHRGLDASDEAVRDLLAKCGDMHLLNNGSWRVHGWKNGLTGVVQRLKKDQAVITDVHETIMLKVPCGNPMEKYQKPKPRPAPKPKKPAPPPSPACVERPHEPEVVCQAPAVAPEPIEECLEEEWITPLRSRNKQVVHSTPASNLSYQAGHTTIGWYRRSRHLDETCGPGTPPEPPPTDW
jgi:hypothetical protein